MHLVTHADRNGSSICIHIISIAQIILYGELCTDDFIPNLRVKAHRKTLLVVFIIGRTFLSGLIFHPDIIR